MPVIFSPLVTYIKAWLLHCPTYGILQTYEGFDDLFGLMSVKNSRNTKLHIKRIAEKENLFYEAFYQICGKKINGTAQKNFRSALKKACMDKKYIEHVKDRVKPGVIIRTYRILNQNKITDEELEFAKTVQLYIENQIIPSHAFVSDSKQILLKEEIEYETGTSTYHKGYKQLHCPMSNQDEAIDNLFSSENLTQSSDNVRKEDKSYVCSSCEEGAYVMGFCLDCEDWLCGTCVDAHRRVRITKDHIIWCKEEMEREKQLTGLSQKYLFCQIHNQEQFKLYCETCEKLICEKCQLFDHQEHKCQFLSKSCEDVKNCIHPLLVKIKDEQQNINSACEEINEHNDKITEIEQAVFQDIKNFAIKYIHELNERGEQLLQNLSDICVQKKTPLSFHYNELITFRQKLEYCVKFAEMASLEGSEMALVYSKKVIINQLNYILKHLCEVPKPQHLVDITFNFEPSYLTQYISHHGALLVDQHPVPQPTSVVPLFNQNHIFMSH